MEGKGAAEQETTQTRTVANNRGVAWVVRARRDPRPITAGAGSLYPTRTAARTSCARQHERTSSLPARRFASPFPASSQLFDRVGSAVFLVTRRPERVCLSSLASPRLPPAPAADAPVLSAPPPPSMLRL